MTRDRHVTDAGLHMCAAKTSARRPIGRVLVITVVLAAVLPVKGQNARGTILGHIQDASGASVPMAQVTVRNLNTNISSTFTTGGEGSYIFENLIPGTYEVQVEARNFKRGMTSGLIVQVDHTLRQDFTLEVGAVSESVSVSAAAQMIQTDNATIGQVMSERYVENLPLNGRDFTSLIQLNAGVTQAIRGDQPQDTHGLNDNYHESSINGARPASINFLIDGVVSNAIFKGGPAAQPPVDAIQEFKLQNGLYSAEYGTGSAQVNVAIRSGTNQYHGTAYDFVRNAAFQPKNKINDAFNKLNDAHLPLTTPFVQNQFGATAGGPIRIPKLYNGRDHSFFFFAYEGGRRVLGSNGQFLRVPTANERQGDFSDWPYPIYNPLTTGSVPATPTNPSGRVPFQGNVIPNGMLDPIAGNLLKYAPAANIGCQMPCLDFVGFTKPSITTNNYTTRLDQVLTARDQLSFTFIVWRSAISSPSVFPTASRAIIDNNFMGGLEWTHSFGPHAVNSFTFGGNRRLWQSGGVTAFGPNLSALVGFNNTNPDPSQNGLPGLNMGQGYSGWGGFPDVLFQLQNVFQYEDNFKYVRGKHEFALGADIRRTQARMIVGSASNGILYFTGSYTASDPSAARNGGIGPTTGNSFADLLLGDAFNVFSDKPAGVGSFQDVRGTNWNFFFQDNYHVTSRLTLNLGLRYEIPGYFHSKNLSGYIFDPNVPGGGRLFASQAFVQTVANNTTFPDFKDYWLCCAPPTLWPIDRKDFAPRLGIAWRPLSDKLVLRTGAGVFYDLGMEYYTGLVGGFNDNKFQSIVPAIYPQPSGSETVSPLKLDTLWYPAQVVPPGTTMNPAYTQAAGPMYFNNKTPWNIQWSFGLQYALTPTLMLDVGYVGLHAARQQMLVALNQAYPPKVAGDPCNFLLDRSLATGANAHCLNDPNFQPISSRTPYYHFADNPQRANVSWANYNSLQVRLEKRFSYGLQFLANYTWSKELDVVSGIDILGSGVGTVWVQDMHNLRSSYGPGDFDIPHRLSLSWIYEAPIGKGKRWSFGKGDYILGGWKLAGNATFAAGLPFSLFCCSTGSSQFGGFSLENNIRVNLSGDPSKGFQQSALQWFNTNVENAPIAGTFGNSGKGILRGPGQREADVSFMKDFAIREKGPKLEYRLEIFNFLSSSKSFQVLPDAVLSGSPANCAPGPSGNCAFGSLVPLNGLGALNLWTPHVIQMALKLKW